MNLLQNKNIRNSLSTRIGLLLSFLMIGVYFSLGLFLLVKGWHALSKTQATMMGVLLIVYALFRVYRVIHESRSRESDEEFSEK